MRRAHLHLDLGGTWIRARWLEPRGWFLGSRQCVFEAWRNFGTEDAALTDALGALAAELEGTGAHVAGARLSAELGMSHACVGLMHLAEGDGARLGAATLQTYVLAWVQQSLHRDPANHIVRWQVLRDPHHVLVSCVRNSTFTTLNSFAMQQALKFHSCVPAVVAAVRASDGRALHTLVCTEGPEQYRASSVQLLRLDRGQLQASWRGWAPVGDSGTCDLHLQGALHRFNAAYGGSSSEQTVYAQWPALVGDARMAG